MSEGTGITDVFPAAATLHDSISHAIGPAATPRRLMWWKFRAHRLALASAIVILLLYLMTLFCGFVAPYDPEFKTGNPLAPPQWPSIVVDGRLQWPPVVFGMKQTLDMQTFQRRYVPDPTKRFPVALFAVSYTHLTLPTTERV